MTRLERIGAALVRPRSALAIAGERRHAGRSGSDLLVAIVVLLVATQLRALVAAAWLGAVVDVSLGVRAVVHTLTETVTVVLAALVVGAAAVYATSGKARDVGRAFDFACVAALPLLFFHLAASVIVYAGQLEVSPSLMSALSGVSYLWTLALIVLACSEARRATPTPSGDPTPPRRAGWALAGLAVVGVIVQVVWIAGNVERVRPMTSGDPAPQFALRQITGEHELGPTVSITPGKVTVIDFWATWCGPCLQAMPHLDALARAHPDIVVLAINIDDPSAAWELFAERKYAMTLLAGDRETSDRYGVSTIPHTVVIDRAGNVRRVFRGSAPSLEREVTSLSR